MPRSPSLAPRLQSLREAAGLTLDQLARKSGLSRPALTKLERGERKPDWETVQRLASALGVSVSAFAGEGEQVPVRLVKAAKAYARAYDQVERQSRKDGVGSVSLFARFQEAQVELNLAALDSFAAKVEPTPAAAPNRSGKPARQRRTSARPV
jgi:transcriptional regulator with XRE-family HTH domain